MARKTKYDWMMGTMEVLIVHGVDGMTLDALTKHLGVTKGSFYHHFADMPTFRKEMLAMCLYESTTHVIERTEVGATPYQKLMVLTELASGIDPLEVAIRAWALRDPDAQATLIEIDARRMEYVAKLYRDLGLDDDSAARGSRFYYSAFVGGLHLMPSLTTPQMLEMFAALRQLAGIKEDN